ncbi:MAG: ribosome maturation factor RimM [Gammaproteobacteria bacterium]|nr:ribosome maturation factor RimM [Gammaproteobacteria bacterium]
MTDKHSDKPIIVGKISGVHGVKGWVKVFSWTQPKENIASYNPLWLEERSGHWRALNVLAIKPQGRTIVAQFEGLDDRDKAAELIGKQLGVQADQLPDLDEGWYWSQLIGLEVMTTDEQSLGTVTEMQETGANDVMIIGKGADAVLIPFVTGPIVKQVDIEAGTILVDWNPEYL